MIKWLRQDFAEPQQSKEKRPMAVCHGRKKNSFLEVDMENFILTLAIVVSGLAILYFILWARIKRMVHPQKILNDISGEVEKILVELNSTTDQNIQLIEDRIRLLKEHLILADKKIALLKRDTGRPSVSIEYNDIISKKRPVTIEPSPSLKISEELPLKDKVLMYYSEGFTPAMIASKVDLPVGEVELIISLAEQLSKE
ncbi:MAG: hypothetical protein JXR70_00495 [Spirochaetales bacterium]|nr:hypothetical protein [Spirochaetales bacterium]